MNCDSKMLNAIDAGFFHYIYKIFGIFRPSTSELGPAKAD